ncbi:MAG: HAD family hydrolase [Bilifractor sp.]
MKTVFLDIDGTLTDFHGKLPDSAAYALRKAAENGHELVICTGRTYAQIYPWMRTSDLFQGIVSGAGTMVRYKGDLVFRKFADPGKLKELIHYLDEIGSLFFLQGDGSLYCHAKRRDDAVQLLGGSEEALHKKEEMLGKIVFTDDLRHCPEINKLVFYHAGVSIRQMQEDLGDYFRVAESSFVMGESNNGEITIQGYDKAFGMKRFLETNGGRWEDTIAFGDGPNDFEMLDYAATGVAMGNAGPELKKTADLVTDPIDQDGILHGFQKLGLI